MKRILLFTDSLGAGGAQRQLVGLALLLQQKGYNIKVCTYHHLDFYKSFLDENKIENELIPGAANEKKRILAVITYLKKECPDCVIAYQETPSLISCVAKSLGCKFRLIVSERNTTQSVGVKERIRFFFYRWADYIVPNSYAQENFLSSHYPWMKTKLYAISNFVDLDRFNFTMKVKREIPLIVIAASIWQPKNAFGLIQAVKLLKDKNRKFNIEWYGITDASSDYLSECNGLIAQMGLENYIRLLPKSKQIQEQYRNCDFFCLPSFYEGTPNVICEAMSCGRPVICSDVCDNPIYVAEGENGFLFDPTNPSSIADAIERALNVTSDEYKFLCKNSRRKAELLLNENEFVDKYIKIINNK